MRRIGVLMSDVETDQDGQTRVTAFVRGLQERGWVDGRNIRIDYRWSGGDASRAGADATELVGLGPDVIMASSTVSFSAVRPIGMRRIGVLMSDVETDQDGQTRVTAFVRGLQERGWVDGRNIRIDYRWSGGDASRAGADATELVGLGPDVIMASSTVSLSAVR